MSERYPSIKALMQIKDVTRADAKQIRAVMACPTLGVGPTRMQQIDSILRTCGVERIERGHGRKSPAIVYCNAGDTYAVTVLRVRTPDGRRFRVGCWGDIVERGNYE